MKVLVIGGAGYIGSSTARLLQRRGDRPLIYDDFSTGSDTFISGLQTIVGDIADREKMSKALMGVDAVIHFAARAYVGESFLDPRGYYETNVSKGLALLNSVVDAKIDKFIFSSSCAVYGSPSDLPITENTLCHPVNPYGHTKLAFENALSAYASAYGLRFLALRYFNAAGAEDEGKIGELHSPETHLIPLIMRAAMTKSPQICVNGNDHATPDGTCIRDYVHVSDLAAAHVAALDRLAEGGGSDFINLGSGTGASILDLLTLTEEITSIKVLPTYGPRRRGDPATLVCDATRACEKLQWSAKFDLKEILRTAWLWEQRRMTMYPDSV